MEDIKKGGPQIEPKNNACQEDVELAIQRIKADKASVDAEYEASIIAVKEWERAKQKDLDRVEEAMRARYEAIEVEVEESSDELRHAESDDVVSMDAFMAEIDSVIKNASEGGI